MKYKLNKMLLTIEIQEIEKLAKHDHTLKSKAEARKKLLNYILNAEVECAAFEPKEIDSDIIEYKILNSGIWSPETAFYEEICVVWEDNKGDILNVALIRDSRLDLVERLLDMGGSLND